MPLKSRLALLSAASMAVAIAAVALFSWFAVRERLLNQIDKSITASMPPPRHDDPNQPGRFFGGGGGGNGSTDPCKLPGLGPGFNLETQITYLKPDGTVCGVGGSAVVDVTAADRAVAQGTQDPYWRDGTTADGTPVRVHVTPDPGNPGAAWLQSQSLAGADDSLTSLAWQLLIAAGVGIACAATAGLVVARAALRPVDRLTDAVEHVARTEDLTVRMPVDGDDEIARLSRSFNAMTAALESSRDEQKRLVDDAGHELRTPLTSLRTAIDLLIRSEESGRALPEGKRMELLKGSQTQMRELTVLIADLLELSRPEQARGSEDARSPVAFDEVVQRAVERVRPRGLARDTPVTLDAELSPWIARGDSAALERAVVNLLDNAVKFSPPGSTVEVRLARGLLTVRDHGPGIPAEELPHVFERFWRSPSARSMPGSGLGLAIAARVVRESGGSVSLEAVPGGGTMARLSLPGRPV
jgi:two-component system sensor histidine kinase MprB